MKKHLLFLITLFTLFMCVGNIKAESIDSINMDVYVDKNGDAHVTEVWEANPTIETEYYHAYYNIGKSTITDLKVKDEEQEYTYMDWDISANFATKAHHYGFNYANNGVELCFGKSSYKHHIYTLTYKISDFVYNTTDNKQIMYWTMLNKINPAPYNVEIKIYSDEKFSNELPVWGYGNYGGIAKVKDGVIYLSNDHLNNTDYMTFLAKFDKKIYKTNNLFNYDFEYIKKSADYGSIRYESEEEKPHINYEELIPFADIIVFVLVIVAFLQVVKFIVKKSHKIREKKKIIFKRRKLPSNRKINKYRDLICGDDIQHIYWLAYQYGLIRSKTDVLGAFLLKFIRDKKLEIKSENGFFNKQNVKILIQVPIPDFDNSIEASLYTFLYDSRYELKIDDVLDEKEFKIWCKNNYLRILNWFDKIISAETEKLINEGKIIEKKSILFYKYEYDDSIREEALKLAGLKKFFEEFDNMTDKEVIDVMLWEEYLMYAQVLGVAKKVAKQFKKVYPDIITDYDFEVFDFISDVTYASLATYSFEKSLFKVMSEIAIAGTGGDDYSSGSDYSSGGGGFSSGGGGGGSFGGGGSGFGGGSR